MKNINLMKLKLLQSFLLLSFFILSPSVFADNEPISLQFRLVCSSSSSNCEKFFDSDAHQDIYVDKNQVLSLKDLKGATYKIQKPVNESPFLTLILKLNSQSKEFFRNFTAQNLNKRLALIIDNQFIFAPVIMETISDGKVAVTTDKDMEKTIKLGYRINNALGLRKDDEESYVDLMEGKFYKDIGDYDKGIAKLNKLIKINPKVAQYYFYLANIYSDMHKFNLAIESFNRVSKFDSNNPYLYFNRGVLYSDLNKFDKSIADLNRALKLGCKEPALYTHLGFAYIGKGDFFETIKFSDEAIKLNPKDAFAYNNKGVAYYFEQNYTKSWESIHKAQSLGLKIKPDFIKSLCNALKDSQCN